MEDLTMSKLTARQLAGPDPNPMTVAEIDALQSLVSVLPKWPRIIQIGAERGCSTLAMLEARPEAFIFSIDVGERPEEITNVRAGGHDFVRVVRGLGRSQNIGAHWPDCWTADLVYIDGDHRYDGVLGDIVAWERIVNDGGLLAFHDYILPEERAPTIVGRVYEAIQDSGLFERYKVALRVERILAFWKVPKND